MLDKQLPTISIIILNYNGMSHNYLPDCLYSLSQQIVSATQIIVVDNASKDDSAVFVATHYPHVQWVQNLHNVGFCKGNNIGYSYAVGEYVLFANNDVVFHATALQQLVNAMQNWPQAGMIAPKLIRPNSGLLDSAGLQLRRDFTLRDRGFGEADQQQFEHPTWLFAPCGAAAFFRRGVLEAVYQRDGMVWDEQFFAYYEDGDLAWRIQNMGWKCLYEPTAVIEHHRGGSSPPTFFNKPTVFQVHTIKNRYLMIMKNAPLLLVLRNLPYVLVREILIWGYLVLHPQLLVDVWRVLWRTLPTAARHFGTANVFECQIVEQA